MESFDANKLIAEVASIRGDLDKMIEILGEIRPLVEAALTAIAEANQQAQGRAEVAAEEPVVETVVAGPPQPSYLAP